MTIEEAWAQIEKPYDRFSKDLIAVREVLKNLESRLKALEAKKVKEPK